VKINRLVGGTVTKKVYLFEEKSCGLSVTKPLVSFLRGELGEEVDVRAFDLSHPEDLIPLPPGLFFKLMSDGSKCLPAMAVDSVVVTEGWLPQGTEALNIVASGVPTRRVDPSSCCSTDSKCC
jgi:hypothetical protein